MARLICSDEACAEEALVEAQTLEELECLACECGCALTLIGWPDRRDDAGAELVVLRPAGVPSDLAA
ncbi:MAG: hypothetical protein M3296_08125 [Actinomycetota bacterium]|nr:hypothetical protein [Actinomycetota bacterium]